MVGKYNLIMITLDSARIDKLRKIENFKKWAEQGTLFSNMITYGPQTVTSLHAIFSGIYGNINGTDNYFGNIKFKKKLCKTIPQYLNERGFYTRGDFINEIVFPHQGFDKITIHDENKDDLIFKHVNLIKKMDELRKKGRNFFLYLHYSKIHTEIIKSIIKKYGDFDEKYFGNRERNLRRYQGFLNEADNYLKEIFNICTKLDLFKDTLFIIFSDHGTSTGEKKGEIGYGRYCYDYTLKTFTLFVQPEIFPKKEVGYLCRTIDVLPTILDVLNIPENNNFIKIQGKTLLPLIREDDGRIAFSESSGTEKFPRNHPPLIRAIRTKKWKFICNHQNNIEELYDLEKDPQEENNIIEKEKTIAKDLREKLNHELREGLKVKIDMIKKKIM